MTFQVRAEARARKAALSVKQADLNVAQQAERLERRQARGTVRPEQARAVRPEAGVGERRQASEAGKASAPALSLT